MDGAEIFNDYERSLGHVIDAARKVTLREFIPFQIGNQKSSSVKFPFRTATCESNSFISNHSNNRLFLDANIGFHIDDDALLDNIRYKTYLSDGLTTYSITKLKETFENKPVIWNSDSVFIDIKKTLNAMVIDRGNISVYDYLNKINNCDELDDLLEIF
jgi:hypothetical protein